MPSHPKESLSSQPRCVFGIVFHAADYPLGDVCLLLVSCMIGRQFARLVEFHQADDTTAGMDQSVLFALGRNTKKQHPHPLSERNENITEADLLNRCCIWTVKSDEAVKQRTYASYASGLC